MSKKTDYQQIKEHLYNNLRKIDGSLEEHQIKNEIESMKTLIESVGLDLYGQIIHANISKKLTESDWKRMYREVEADFDVKMDQGILMTGSNDDSRDKTWWTYKGKVESDNYYWNRYKNYISEKMQPSVIKTLDEDTEVIMNNIEDPNCDSFARYGMVVGHVQSGKTGNYLGLICKAADAGYKFIVVIAGSMNNLRNQTQSRVNEGFIGHSNGIIEGVGKGNFNRAKSPFSLTTLSKDFNKRDADTASQGINFENVNVPVVLVIKKNTSTLKSVISWLKKQYKNKISDHAMLLIDDESDYASINTKSEDDPTTINKNIRELISLFKKSSYVAYTATPYANIFIDHKVDDEYLGKDLFPKDFIYALEAPTNYFGAKKIFNSDNEFKYVIDITDDTYIPLNHKKDFKVSELPPSLLDAINRFILNIAFRNLRGVIDHNSMLIHATRFTDVHKEIAYEVNRIIENISNNVVAYGKSANSKQLCIDLYNAYIENYDLSEFTWEEVISEIVNFISTVQVIEVHSKSKIKLEYKKDSIVNVIAVGGTSLSRGYTLEGLSISYFLRNTVFYDTLMQMGRWFGYRPGYEDLCRIYLKPEKRQDFAEIIRATETLMKDFELMAENGSTPNDFGLAIQENPDSALQITARNKQKNVKEYYHSMKLDGKSKETSIINPSTVEYNLKYIKSFINHLPKPSEHEGSGYVWREIERNVIQNFLAEFKTFSSDPLGLISRMPIDFIKEYAIKQDTKWDIALYNGLGKSFNISDEIIIGKEKRKLIVKDNGTFEFANRQISSGNAEAIVFDKKLRTEIGSNRNIAREKLNNPLLMLHIVEPTFNTDQKIDTIAAFGVSFPGNINSETETIKLLINTVYYDNLLNNIDEEYDD